MLNIKQKYLKDENNEIFSPIVSSESVYGADGNPIKLDKSVITASFSQNFTVTTKGINKISLDKVLAQKGNKLKLENGEIVVGTGVDYVLVSAQGFMSVKSGGAKNFMIYHNDSECIVSMNSIDDRSPNLNLGRALGARLVKVKEGDTFTFGIYGAIDDVVTAVQVRNFITIQET